VERIALRRVLARVATTPELLKNFRSSIEDMRRAAVLGDRLAYCQADLAFHGILIETSESPLLRPVWDSLSRGILVFLMQERDITFDYDESIAEHELLLNLIHTGKPTAVDREIERHIMGYVHQHLKPK
jgi:DNA-binding GntR family transcriptional regulator